MYNYLVREDSDWNVIYGVITFFEEEDFNRAVAAIRRKKEQWYNEDYYDWNYDDLLMELVNLGIGFNFRKLTSETECLLV